MIITTVLLSATVSFVSLLVFWALGRSRLGYLCIVPLATVGGILSTGLVWPAAGLQMLFTIPFALVGLAFNPPPRIGRWLMVAPLLLGYAMAIPEPIEKMRHLEELRLKFPLESLAARLAFEHHGGVDGATVQPIHLAPQVAAKLNRVEQGRDGSWNRRRSSLELLYGESRERFILATGFGPGRMRQVYPDMIVLEDAGPVSLTDALASRKAAAGESAKLGWPFSTLPGAPTLAQLHDEGLSDFLNPERMGYFEDVDHVAGFESHRFTKMPKTAGDPRLRWTVVRMELIGLLKYDEPRAYVSEYLPRLDELGKAATREVDDFEHGALQRLQSDEDLVLEETPGRVRMLGSLRASKDCLECHSVQRGELMGALSYEILPLEQNRDTLADQARLNPPLPLPTH